LFLGQFNRVRAGLQPTAREVIVEESRQFRLVNLVAMQYLPELTTHASSPLQTGLLRLICQNIHEDPQPVSNETS
jgi:hypothetical protein